MQDRWASLANDLAWFFQICFSTISKSLFFLPMMRQVRQKLPIY
jgi:hypothetical protein